MTDPEYGVSLVSAHEYSCTQEPNKFGDLTPYLTYLSNILMDFERRKQDTSLIFLPQKRANEIGNLTPLSIMRL
jgi:hypothetical protein